MKSGRARYEILPVERDTANPTEQIRFRRVMVILSFIVGAVRQAGVGSALRDHRGVFGPFPKLQKFSKTVVNKTFVANRGEKRKKPIHWIKYGAL